MTSAQLMQMAPVLAETLGIIVDDGGAGRSFR